MLKIIPFVLILLGLTLPLTLSARERHIHSSAGLGGSGLPLYVAKSTGIFEKYGLDVDLLVIPGGPLGMQVMLSGGTHSGNIAAMTPIRTILGGGDIVIVGGYLNRQMFNLVARKEIRKPADLVGKKIGVASLAGTNAVAIRLVFKEWKIPMEAVTLIVAGGSPLQLSALEAGTIDATVLTYGVTPEAVRKGMTILADLAKPVPEFPDRTIITRRSFLKKERDNIKRFIQGISEGIYRLRTADDRKREELVTIVAKHLRVNATSAREFYDLYENAFSFPPRVGRKGMAAVMDIIQEETGRPKAEFELNRFLDESVIDELEKEGFFKRLELEYTRR
jgi:ABC-type nitrate/sulfonate/bicarbonate transport system substrate-binding protein